MNWLSGFSRRWRRQYRSRRSEKRGERVGEDSPEPARRRRQAAAGFCETKTGPSQGASALKASGSVARISRRSAGSSARRAHLGRAGVHLGGACIHVGPQIVETPEHGCGGGAAAGGGAGRAGRRGAVGVYRRRRSSRVSPARLRILFRVPGGIGLPGCIGTTSSRFGSVRWRRTAWLPDCRSTTNPAGTRARTGSRPSRSRGSLRLKVITPGRAGTTTVNPPPSLGLQDHAVPAGLFHGEGLRRLP